MLPESTGTRRRPVRAWITAGFGIALIAVAAAALVTTAVFGAPGAGPAAGGAAAGGPAAGEAGLAASLPTAPGATASPTTSTLATTPPTNATPTGAPPVTAAPKPAATTPKLTGEAAFEAQVLTLVNAERAKAGCKALVADSRLAKAAKAHSADMAARNYFEHTTPDGVEFATRITNAGYRWSAAAENIAMGQKDPASVMTSWMNSSGHRANILNCGYRNLGVGLAYNTKKAPYWTQDFGTPA